MNKEMKKRILSNRDHVEVVRDVVEVEEMNIASSTRQPYNFSSRLVCTSMRPVKLSRSWTDPGWGFYLDVPSIELGILRHGERKRIRVHQKALKMQTLWRKTEQAWSIETSMPNNLWSENWFGVLVDGKEIIIEDFNQGFKIKSQRNGRLNR